ncbi:MAG: hypothetical protein IKJ95_08080 [Bacteroidaceae bacterium]|nr:hypothetical protein [Bacteroidaceae bacterium]
MSHASSHNLYGFMENLAFRNAHAIHGVKVGIMMMQMNLAILLHSTLLTLKSGERVAVT